MLKSSRPDPLVHAAVGAQAEDPGLEHLEGGLEAVERDVGDERARLLPADSPPPPPATSARREATSGRLVRAIGIRSSSARPGSIRVIWRWSCSSGSTTARGSSRSTFVRSGALDPPLLPRRDGLLLEVGEHVPGPVDLERPGPGRGSGVAIRSTRSCAPLDPVERAGIHPPVLVHHEVGVGGLEQGVVLRRLDVPVPGVQDLPGHQGLVDGIGRGDDPQGVSPQAGTGVEEVRARRRS